jgi:hypothetical protein
MSTGKKIIVPRAKNIIPARNIECTVYGTRVKTECAYSTIAHIYYNANLQ